MKQNAQWLSHVAPGRRSPRRPRCRAARRRASSTTTSNVRAAPTELERDDGFVGEQLVVDDVAEYRPVQRQELVADRNPGQFRRRRGRDALDLRKRHPPSVAGGLASLSAVEVDRVLLAEPGVSAPGSRWRSRPWPGWCGSSSRPSTATTRSSTTASSSRSSRARASSSSTTSTRSPPGRRSCSPPTARPPRSSGPRRRTTARSSTPSAPSSPRSTTS